MSSRTENLSVYRDFVARFFGDDVKGKANPYTSMNGNMYSFMDDQGRICLRLSEENRAHFAAMFETEPVVQYGAVMKGYVAIPIRLYTEPDALKDVFQACLFFAKDLSKK